MERWGRGLGRRWGRTVGIAVQAFIPGGVHEFVPGPENCRKLCAVNLQGPLRAGV